MAVLDKIAKENPKAVAFEKLKGHGGGAAFLPATPTALLHSYVPGQSSGGTGPGEKGHTSVAS